MRGTAGAAGILVLAYADTDKSGIIKMAGNATVDLILMSMSFLFRATSRGFLMRRLLAKCTCDRYVGISRLRSSKKWNLGYDRK